MFLFLSFLLAIYLTDRISYSAAAGVTKVGASILDKNLSVERKEPLPRIYIELRWRLSSVN